MTDFWEIIASFPTSIFTTTILVLIGYWLLVAFGLFDFDFIDLDIDSEVDTSELSGVASFMATFGLTGVPVTIVLTILIFVASILCYTTVKFGLFWVEQPWIILVAGSTIIVLSLALALPITAQLIKPLRKLFARLYGDSGNKNLLGRPCKIRSSKVTRDFGEAESVIDGASLIVKIYAKADNQFATGDTAYIVEQNDETQRYLVVTETEFYQTNYS